MALWFAALLGLVQGLTEFLPISSSAHLRIAPALLGQPDPGAAFSAVIQLGTLLAVIIYFAKDLFVVMPRALLRRDASPDARMPVYMVVGTIPIAVVGLLFQDLIVGDARSLYVVSGALILVALVMYYADRVGKKARLLASVTMADALIVGVAQACALVPGVSRSGATITAALFIGLRREDAARLSFLLGIPAIGAAGLYELKDALGILPAGGWQPIAVGTAVSFVSGYASIAWLMRFLGNHKVTVFVLYRIVLGVTLLALLGATILAAS